MTATPPHSDIILHSGQINKDKINLLSGAISKPFTEMVWVVSNGDPQTLNQVIRILISMNTIAERVRLVQILRLMHGLLGLRFPEEVERLRKHPEALRYLIFSLALDFEEIIQEFTSEAKAQTTFIAHET